MCVEIKSGQLPLLTINSQDKINLGFESECDVANCGIIK